MQNRQHISPRKTIAAAGIVGAALTAGLAFVSPAQAATTAVFVKGQRVLTVYGDSRGNDISVGRDTSGNLEVDGGTVIVHGAHATVGNVDRILILGRAGSDRVSIDEANGPLPAATVYGGSGNDELFGSSAADRLFGQAGNDTMLGLGGDDHLGGGYGDDTLVGGVGTDRVFGNAGDDRMVWNPGDESDLNEGGYGTDVVEVNGGSAGETFTAAANGTRVRFDRVTPVPFTLDIGTSEQLVVNANGGDDSFSTSGDLAHLIALRVDGGTGNDRISGGTGNDALNGGDGNDFVDGNQGSDTSSLGTGDDTFVWDAGDGSDTVEGQIGQDTLVFNGADIAEDIHVSAAGSRARLVRDVGHVSMDLGGVERVDTNAFGGADTLTVDDLSGTDVTEANINLAASGSAAGDLTADSVTINGTDGVDKVQLTGAQPDGVAVSGLRTFIRVSGTDRSLDALTLDALAGDDSVEAGGLSDGVVAFTANGGDGADTIGGSAGDDVLNGDNGDDILNGGPGHDVLNGGAGNNTLIQ